MDQTELLNREARAMATCEKLAKCPFYQGQMRIDSGIGAMYKKKYCEGDKNLCARYAIATTVGPEFVTTSIYHPCRNTPAFRHGDIRHTLFPR